MKLKNAKILVTGAGGFIGSHLTEELAISQGAGHIRALVHYNSRNDWGKLEELPSEILSGIEVVSGDIRDPFFSQKITRGVDVIFHLAAAIAIPFSYEAPEHYVSTNIHGTLNILEGALKNDVAKVIHTSTSEVYGTAQYTPIDEKHPLVGQSPYSATKIAADKLAESFFRSYALPVATVRPFNTFGPRQSARAVIPTIISQLIGGKKVKIGSLAPVRDFTYVKDTVMGFIKAAESDKTVGETVNIGSGEGISIGKLFDKICGIMDIKNSSSGRCVRDVRRIRPDKSEVMMLICDNRKARRDLGWSPRYSLDVGLEETISYIRRNIGRYKPFLYNL